MSRGRCRAAHGAAARYNALRIMIQPLSCILKASATLPSEWCSTQKGVCALSAELAALPF
jgi:hypothetical protein